MLIRWKDIKLNEEAKGLYFHSEHIKKLPKKGRKIVILNAFKLFHLIKNQMMKWKKSDDILFIPFGQDTCFYTRFRIICKNAEIKRI